MLIHIFISIQTVTVKLACQKMAVWLEVQVYLLGLRRWRVKSSHADSLFVICESWLRDNVPRMTVLAPPSLGLSSVSLPVARPKNVIYLPSFEHRIVRSEKKRNSIWRRQIRFSRWRRAENICVFTLGQRRTADKGVNQRTQIPNQVNMIFQLLVCTPKHVTTLVWRKTTAIHQLHVASSSERCVALPTQNEVRTTRSLWTASRVDPEKHGASQKQLLGRSSSAECDSYIRRSGVSEYEC